MNGFALYKLPHQKSISLKSGIWKSFDPNFSKGFIVNDFENQQKYFLPGPAVEWDSEPIDFEPNRASGSDISYSEYIKTCQEIINSCAPENKKLVFSRTKSIQTNTNLFEIFKALTENYPNCFTYFFHISNRGTWMGATPEKLIQAKNLEFETMALAGTKNSSDNSNWETKELKEHGFVVDYLYERLNDLKIEFSKSDTKELKSGKVKHLCTPIKFKTNISALTIAETFHPTPAVCGTPKKWAQENIQKFEKHDRSFYTGYIGLISPEESHLFVNLRCMQCFNSQVKLYVGGGITAESNPEKEWEETELKARTLESVILKQDKTQFC